MAEKTFSKRIARTELDKAKDKLSRARSPKMKKYWEGIVEIRLDEYNSLAKGGMPTKKMRSGGMVKTKKMRGGGMMKTAAKKKMMRGGAVAKKKMMRGGMAAKKRGK